MCASCKEGIVIMRVPEYPQKKHGIAVLYAATRYHERVIAQLIAHYKYEFAREISLDLAELLLKHLSYAHFEKKESHIIVPVPLHAKRLRRRGFNQADLIAKEIAKRHAIPYHPTLLMRVKNTVPQIEMSRRADRIKNIEGAFMCAKPETVKNKTAIIVDDVSTTGATLAECARALKQAGARSVIAFVVAK